MSETNSVENQASKDLSIEQKLAALYKLQTIMSDIDKIRALRGELPLEVQDLEDEIMGLQTRLQAIANDIENLKAATETAKREMGEAQALVERYKQQIDNVRNNHEFMHLNKEIEYQGLEIELAQKHINEYAAAIERKNEDQESNKAALEEKRLMLVEKQEELEEITQETKKEEDSLRERAKDLEQYIEPRLLTAFKRIRKNARNGLAVVTVQRDACGGCFNKIPAQRQLDIRLRKKVIVCEHCGRILIDPEMAEEQKEQIEKAGE